VQTGGNTYTLNNVTATASLQVTFKLIPSATCVVTPNAGANGSINPSAPKTVNSGDSLTLTATPTNGYTVDQWLVNGSVAQTGGNSFLLSNVTSNTSVQVIFKLLPTGPFTVTPSAGDNGTISP